MWTKSFLVLSSSKKLLTKLLPHEARQWGTVRPSVSKWVSAGKCASKVGNRMRNTFSLMILNVRKVEIKTTAFSKCFFLVCQGLLPHSQSIIIRCQSEWGSKCWALILTPCSEDVWHYENFICQWHPSMLAGWLPGCLVGIPKCNNLQSFAEVKIEYITIHSSISSEQSLGLTEPHKHRHQH